VSTQEKQSSHLRLPGFLLEKEIGLGDAFARVTSALGVRPCDGCYHRAEKLNQWVSFGGRAR
jgi:hypothetical protein